jgi:hypothetical protein
MIVADGQLVATRALGITARPFSKEWREKIVVAGVVGYANGKFIMRAGTAQPSTRSPSATVKVEAPSARAPENNRNGAGTSVRETWEILDAFEN